MTEIVCRSCGSNDLTEIDGFMICNYCGTRHVMSKDEKGQKQVVIDWSDDVSRLIQKSKDEPERAKKYAERILEMDPNNEYAKKLLMPETKSGGCYVATAVYGSYDCPEVWTLRRFRDSTLASTWYGLLFTKTYYAVSPTLVRWFGDS